MYLLYPFSSVSASTYNGDTSYVELEVDTAVVPFGDSGSFQFRSRAVQGRLLLLQLMNTEGGPSDSLEFQLFERRLQVTLRATQSMPQSYVSEET